MHLSLPTSESMVEYRVLDTRNFRQTFEYSKFRVIRSSNRALIFHYFIIFSTFIKLMKKISSTKLININFFLIKIFYNCDHLISYLSQMCILIVIRWRNYFRKLFVLASTKKSGNDQDVFYEIESIFNLFIHAIKSFIIS
jgi:hypothetical protein